MKDLIALFKYIHKYHQEPIIALFVWLCFAALKKIPNAYNELLAQKGKSTPSLFYELLAQNFKIDSMKFTEPNFTQDFAPNFANTPNALNFAINPSLNYKKVLKTFAKYELNAAILADFLDELAFMHPIFRLDEYASPRELNILAKDLLRIKKEHSVYVPCCGIGSFALCLEKGANFVGSDISQNSANLAQLLCEMSEIFSQINIQNAQEFAPFDELIESDLDSISALLAKQNEIEIQSNKQQFTQNSQSEKFERIFCYPPSSLYAGRRKMGAQVPFLLHSISRLKANGKALFVAPSALLYKNAAKSFRHWLIENKLLEAIIELPNFFARSNTTNYLLLVSFGNKNIFFFNANNEHFILQKNKQNRLVNADEIADANFAKQNTNNSKPIKYNELNAADLRVGAYLQPQKNQNEIAIYDLLSTHFLGAKQNTKDELKSCYEIGASDFAPFGYTNLPPQPTLAAFSALNALCKDDLVLCIRGAKGKIAIIGELDNALAFANSGLFVLRFKDKKAAQAAYVFFQTQKGADLLSKIYRGAGLRANIDEILKIRLPRDFIDFLPRFAPLCELGAEISQKYKQIAELLS